MRKWLNINISCCLTEASGLSNQLLHLEIRPDVQKMSLSIVFSVVELPRNDKVDLMGAYNGKKMCTVVNGERQIYF